MKVLVTGGCGFIGRHLVRALALAGKHVHVLDLQRACGTALVPHMRGDICNISAADLKGFDTVFHLAAVSRTVPAISDPVECIRTNVLGTVNILEAARQAGVQRVVLSSSNVVLAGATAYRASKIALEQLCSTYVSLYNQSVIALRYSNVYGTGIPVGDPAVFSMLRDTFRAKGWAEVTGDGTQRRDFTHVSDVVAANIAAAEKTGVVGTVDICTGAQTTVNEACAMLKIPVKYIGERPGDVPSMYQNPTPAVNLLEWKAKVKIADGIQDIWEAK